MLKPGQPLENAIKIINSAMRHSNTEYWLCFGGLWGIVMNDGVIPDGDIDICVRYGQDYKRIQKAFSGCPGGYHMDHALLDDTNRSNALHCSYNSSMGFPHICLSFWYPYNGILYYCHDQNFEVHGEDVPASGYFFKGIPEHAVKYLRMVEWPGIVQSEKISVPRFPGVVLDNLYPDWAYRKQRYNIGKKHEVDRERMVSYHKGGAISPYRIHVTSMAQFSDKKYISNELEASAKVWETLLKNRM